MFSDEQMFWGGLAVFILATWLQSHQNPSTHAQRVGFVIGAALTTVSMISLSDRYFFYNGAGPITLFVGSWFGAGIGDGLDDMGKDEQDD